MHLFEIDKKLFAAAFSLVGRVANKDTDPFVQLVSDAGSQQLTLSATNIQSAFITTVDAQVSSSDVLLIDRLFFTQVLPSFLGERLVFRTIENEIQVSSNAPNGDIAIRVARVDRARMRLPDDTQFTPVLSFASEGFARTMNRLAVTISDEDAMVTGGVHLFTRNDRLWMETADRSKGLSRAAVGPYQSHSDTSFDFVALANPMRMIASVIANEAHEAITVSKSPDSGLLKFDLGTTTLYGATYGDSFVAVEPIYTYHRIATAVVGTKYMQAACNLVYLASEEHDFAKMYLDIYDNRVEIRPFRTDTGRSTASTLEAAVTWNQAGVPNPLTCMVGAAQIDALLPTLRSDTLLIAPLTRDESATIVCVELGVPGDVDFRHMTNIFHMR